MKQIALIKTGGTITEIKSQHGDFEDWFAEGLGVSDLLKVDVFKQQALPSTENLAGIVITGSAAMVSDEEDWSERTAEWLAHAVGKGIGQRLGGYPQGSEGRIRVEKGSARAGRGFRRRFGFGAASR